MVQVQHEGCNLSQPKDPFRIGQRALRLLHGCPFRISPAAVVILSFGVRHLFAAEVIKVGIGVFVVLAEAESAAEYTNSPQIDLVTQVGLTTQGRSAEDARVEAPPPHKALN